MFTLTPQLKIVSPTNGQTILGDKITISFIISDFTVGQDGYLRLWLDDPGLEASRSSKITGNFDYTLSDLAEGAHMITLEAVGGNNISFIPKVKQTVTFNTTLPQIPTTTPSPTPFNLSSFATSINWQYILLFTALVITSMGIIVKLIWGKPKNWE